MTQHRTTVYDEEDLRAESINTIIRHGLTQRSNALLIIGASLTTDGVKFLVKDFATAVHEQGGKVVFVNLTGPAMVVFGIAYAADPWLVKVDECILCGQSVYMQATKNLMWRCEKIRQCYGADVYIQVHRKHKYYEYSTSDEPSWPKSKPELARTYPIPVTKRPRDFVSSKALGISIPSDNNCDEKNSQGCCSAEITEPNA
ncbi:hypothetical protein CcaCcLH18_13216 [Colletotrichum camelliae]|nr:hypothetical protein CcaCcLH18_13216 [Colletotrichum camelliae]